MKLDRNFYLRSAVEVAQDLIGKKLIHKTAEGLTAGIIIETEAYMGKIDEAAHSYKTFSERTRIFYGEGGFVYIFLIYGMHFCFNIVTNFENIPEAVLIRALEPTDGIELMKARRNKNNLRDLCSGPGKLCQAMAITKNLYGADLCGDEIFIEEKIFNPQVTATKRINIDYAGEAANYLWRFIMTNDC